jgi:lipopolysaccharide biosynthesis protein
MPVAIAGMHRSGTSMIARLLNLCGLYLGESDDLLPATDNNRAGFWERAKLVDINNQILNRLSGGWDMVPSIEPGWTSQNIFNNLKIAALQEIQTLSQHQPWGWKDPRTSLVLEFWIELIPDLKFVICIRNPCEVYHSLAKQGGVSSQFAYRLWLEYYKHLLAHLSPSQYIVTHYDTFFHDPVNELRRLLTFANISATEQQIQDACYSISHSLKHHTANSAGSEIDEPPTEVMAMYANLCGMAGPIYHSTDTENFDGTQIFDEAFEYRRKISDLKREIQEKENIIREKRNIIQEKEAIIQEKEKLVFTLNAHLEAIFQTPGWRILRLLRRMLNFFIPPESHRMKFLRAIFLQPMHRVYALLIKSREVIRVEGWSVFFGKIRNKLGIKKAHPESTFATLEQGNASIYTHPYQNSLRTASAKNVDEFVPLTETEFSSERALVKLVAFYLPQFHPIPENNIWWGRGFTEWSNVSKAVPQFVGHYQPHLPGELGFYDLRLPEVEERQVELARKYGIHGFAFYYYWFNGKRLLERPLDNYLHNQNIDFPFCICWANENWTRRWDGLENDILIAQDHTPESDIAFIRDLAPLLRDSRYIHINDRPLIIIYRAQLLPELAETVKRWREYCRQEGLGNPYLVAVQGFGFDNPYEIDFDAAIEFPPLNQNLPDINSSMKILNPQYQGKIYRYYDVIRNSRYRKLPSFKLFRGVFPGWDNEARKPERGFSFAFSSPRAYQSWLNQVCQETIQTESDPEKRLVFINAWNEWAEGAHLEPDRKYGYAYLEATTKALRALSLKDPHLEEEKLLFGKTIQKSHDTAVFLHLFYPDMWDELSRYIDNLRGDFDLFISIPNSVRADITQYTAYHKDTYIYRCENWGRDVAPFLRMYRAAVRHQYQQALKLHTKKSKHRQDGDKWRIDLYRKLMGTPELVQSITKTFDKDLAHRIGIIAPDGHVVSSEYYLASNKENVEKLARLANLNYFGDEFPFVAGSMFWFRMESLFPLSLLGLEIDDFDPEQGQVDGTLAHALERIFGMLIYKTGYLIYLSDGQNLLSYDTATAPKTYRFARLHPNR